MKIENQDIVANEKIPFLQLQMIDETGENRGLYSKDDALKYAFERDLDLVLVSKGGEKAAPVAKVMNLNKKIYEDKKKLAKAKKNQIEVQTKELRISPKIGNHDLEIKCRQAIEFLKDGNRVKFLLQLKGRERSLKSTLGYLVFEKLEKIINDFFSLQGRSVVFDIDSDTQSTFSKIYYLKK
jgi:translation initiation factor IF-3